LGKGLVIHLLSGCFASCLLPTVQ